MKLLLEYSALNYLYYSFSDVRTDYESLGIMFQMKMAHDLWILLTQLGAPRLSSLVPSPEVPARIIIAASPPRF